MEYTGNPKSSGQARLTTVDDVLGALALEATDGSDAEPWIVAARPSLPPFTDDAQNDRQLLLALAGLPAEEILSLCYTFRAAPSRLRLYQDALRRRGGERALVASCLVCFDRARRGDTAARRELGFLCDLVRPLARRYALIGSLLGDNAYLHFLWELLQAHLAEPCARLANTEA